MAATFLDTIREFLPTSEWIAAVDPESELGKQAHTAEGLYTLLVRLTSRHAIPCLARLGGHLWDVTHHRHSVVALYNRVTTVTVAIQEHKVTKTQQCVVLVPPTWPQMFAADPLMQWGAVIYTGSQVVDHFNGRLRCESSDMIKSRGAAYEAELILDAQKARSPADQGRLNDYQRRVLQDHPHGFEAKYAYVYRDVVGSRS